MELFNLLLFIMTSVGITNIIVNGSIFEPIRQFIENKSSFLGDMLQCPMCTGFWVGMAASFWFSIPVLIAAALTSLFSHVFNSVIDLIDVLSAMIASKVSTDGEEIDEG